MDIISLLQWFLDEYGIIKGMITSTMLLDEFTSALRDKEHLGFKRDEQGDSFEVNGSTNLRDLNKMFDCDFVISDDGPKTLNGMLLEDLEVIPIAKSCLRIGKYQFDIISLNKINSTIDKVKITVVDSQETEF